jgi:hypothetical protein
MRTLIILVAFLIPFGGIGQKTPKQILEAASQRFGKVQTYSAGINLIFQIPGVQLEPITGKVYYKKPSKFRIHSKGIIFLPKQNPYYALQSIRDTNSFTAVPSGAEVLNGKSTTVISVIPTQESDDLILGKFWIEESTQLVHKVQLTTKTNGTITIEQRFGSFAGYGLPDEIKFIVDVAKFKIPKAVAMELNSKAAKGKDLKNQKGTGEIILRFSNYILNKKLDEKVFEESKAK